MTDIEIPVKYQSKMESGYAYLASRHHLEWYPVAYGETNGKTIHYAAVGKNILYLPVHYINNVQTSAGDPFGLDDDGNINYHNPDSQDTLLMLTEIGKNTNSQGRAVLNGVIEASDCSAYCRFRLFFMVLLPAGLSTLPA